ncbi:MAG TPA: hypothetical protein VLH13_04570 [Methanomassiliicoccales archaeon]|nr:hypothetical protein [Methanomassiliicoccales archaeon]
MLADNGISFYREFPRPTPSAGALTRTVARHAAVETAAIGPATKLIY